MNGPLTPETTAPETFESFTEAVPDAKLEAKRLDFFYGKNQALFDVNIGFQRHAVTALIGPSGCGKSTLLRALNRIYALYPGQKAEGEILLDGENILDRGVDLAHDRPEAVIGVIDGVPAAVDAGRRASGPEEIGGGGRDCAAECL